MAMSNLERQRKLHQKRAAKGLAAMTIFAPKDRRQEMKSFARILEFFAVDGVVVRNAKTGRVQTVTLDQF